MHAPDIHFPDRFSLFYEGENHVRMTHKKDAQRFFGLPGAPGQYGLFQGDEFSYKPGQERYLHNPLLKGIPAYLIVHDDDLLQIKMFHPALDHLAVNQPVIYPDDGYHSLTSPLRNRMDFRPSSQIICTTVSRVLNFRAVSAVKSIGRFTPLITSTFGNSLNILRAQLQGVPPGKSTRIMLSPSLIRPDNSL